MKTIVEQVKSSLGVPVDNFGFDEELMIHINAAKSTLIQFGVDELDIDIDDTTVWPVFNSDIVGELSKQYIVLRVRVIFDPIASETIAKQFNEWLGILEARINHEIEETTV